MCMTCTCSYIPTSEPKLLNAGHNTKILSWVTIRLDVAYAHVHCGYSDIENAVFEI